MTTGETPLDRCKRLRLRAWRRGTKEMDLILGRYADARLAGMDAAALDAFEAVLAEDDHALLQWVLGQAAPPAQHAPLIDVLAEFARQSFAPEG